MTFARTGKWVCLALRNASDLKAAARCLAREVMEWFSKLFSRPGKAKREYPNLTRGKDPLELWNKTGELGDGAFGKVYKVKTRAVCSPCACGVCIRHVDKCL